MKNALAFANNDISIIAWSYGARPDGCMGFAIYRVDAGGTETPLPSHAVFKGYENPSNQTTEEFPVQKFYWKDPYARLEGDKTGSYAFRYKIVPLEGKPGNLVPMKTQPFLITNEVVLSSECSPSLSATFNRGLISTQHVSLALKGRPSKAALLARIQKPGDQLRTDLAGDTLPTLTSFLQRAKSSGQIFAALYELTDKELISGLVNLKSRLNIVVADIAAKPPGSDGSSKSAKAKAKKQSKAPSAPENQPAWNAIKKSAGTALYRLPPSSHIVHNKFLVYVTSSGPQAVLTGSTNWTATGLCAQTNNVLVIDDPKVAARYMAYWKALKADEQAHEKGGPFQGQPLRTFDRKAQDIPLDTGASEASTLTSYFSPNTPKQRAKKHTSEAEPIDMKDLESRIMAARSAVLFLAFIPGSPSIVSFAAEAQRANKNLFVRGCVTSPDASGLFYYQLRGSSPPKSTKSAGGSGSKKKKAPLKEDPRVIAAKALTKADAPTGWVEELLKAGFAITHDKIVVIDPFDDHCVVATGSHNLGYQASYNNDENLVFVEGNKKLAEAYATHVLDVYDHFAWRWSLGAGGKQTDDSYLKPTPDQWLSWYYDADGNIKTAQLKFWLNAGVKS